MNSKTNFLIQFVIFIAGIVLIVTHNHVDVMRWIVIFMGCAIILPALITMGAAALSGHRASADEPHAHRAARTWAVSVSIFAIVLGVAMLCAPTFFATFIAWVFAALLIAAGCYHILVVSYLSRPFVLPFWYYIIPRLSSLITETHNARTDGHLSKPKFSLSNPSNDFRQPKRPSRNRRQRRSVNECPKG